MSAYDDIKAALDRARARKVGWERAIIVGLSGSRSIRAAIAAGSAPEWAVHEIMGVPVMMVQSGDDSVKGWTIRDCSPWGQWHDLEGRPSDHPDFDKLELLRFG